MMQTEKKAKKIRGPKPQKYEINPLKAMKRSKIGEKISNFKKAQDWWVEHIRNVEQQITKKEGQFIPFKLIRTS